MCWCELRVAVIIKMDDTSAPENESQHLQIRTKIWKMSFPYANSPQVRISLAPWSLPTPYQNESPSNGLLLSHSEGISIDIPFPINSSTAAGNTPYRYYCHPDKSAVVHKCTKHGTVHSDPTTLSRHRIPGACTRYESRSCRC
jgi:hypothetical protein